MSDINCTNKIMSILNSYRKNPFQESFDSSFISDKIYQFCTQKKPIFMVFPGFHGKINNPEFVLSNTVDMGDLVGLKNIIGLMKEIDLVYEFGCRLSVIHECHFYIQHSSLVGSELDISTYMSDFRRLIATYDNIESVSIYEMIPTASTLEQALEIFYSQYAPSLEEVSQLLLNKNYLNLYIAYKKVNSIHLDYDTKQKFHSNKAKKDKIKELAMSQMQTYFGFGKLVKEYFKDQNYIRLSSLYKSPEFNECVAINYLPNNHHMSTPTFNCLVKYKNGVYDFMKKKDAFRNNFVLTEKFGLKYFLEQ